MSYVPTAHAAWESLFEGLVRLRARWPVRGWSWDSRLACVSSSFPVEVEDRARAAAKEAFSESWTRETLAKAPPRVRVVAEKAGGMRSGQLVLASAGPTGVLTYGLWWPWGDGMTISLRVGLADVDDASELTVQFRGLFGVVP
jgi:hypothetical protein